MSNGQHMTIGFVLKGHLVETLGNQTRGRGDHDLDQNPLANLFHADFLLRLGVVGADGLGDRRVIGGVRNQ